MILSNVNIGTGPSSGDGSPLRSAFSIINNNFQLITNNVNALTNSVNSVAGRTGNVILTVNDIVGLTPANYPNAAVIGGWISANVAALVDGAPDVLNTLNEIATAINDDANIATTLTNLITSSNIAMKGYVDSVATLSSYGNSNVKAYLTSGFDGDILPSANVTYSLGNVTHQWRDLWVSNSTVYIGGIPVSISNGTLTVNNQPIAGASLVNTDGNARITANDGVISYTWTFETDGSIRTPNDLLTIGGYTLLTDNDNELDLNNGNDITIRSNVGNISIGTDWNNNQHTWNFNNDGTNTFPTGLHFKPMGEIEHTSGTLLLQSSSYDIQLSANASGTSTNWQFHQSGNLVLPNGTVIRDTGSSGSTSGLALGNNGFTLDFGSAINDWAIMSGARLIQVQPDDAFNITFGELANWQFSNTGIITFPDSTVQTTAWTGNITGNITVGNSAINFVANSSGDGNGFSTIELRPDDVNTSSENYLIIDPTSPNHIHIRGGGQQDNSQAELYLGGENSYFKVNNGANPDVSVAANNYVWSYGVDGNLIFPDSTVQSTAWTGEINNYVVGYRDVPQVAAGNVTLGLTDAGKHYYANAAHVTTLTIPSNANVAFPIGTAVTIVNAGIGNISISKETEANLYLAGNSTNATRTLTSYGMATLLKTANDEWFVNGTGLV